MSDSSQWSKLALRQASLSPVCVRNKMKKVLLQKTRNEDRGTILTQQEAAIDHTQYGVFELVRRETWNPPIPRSLLQHVHERIWALAQQPVYEQGTEEWLQNRTLRITASAVATLLNVGWANFRNPEAPFAQSDLMMLRKAGFVEPFAGSDATRHGQMLEPEGRLLYAQMAEEHLALFGLLIHRNYWFVGASPDAICLRSGRLLELKCPKSRTVKVGNAILSHYWMQVQLQLEVCDAEECDFFEYRVMKRDPKIRTNLVRIKRCREWFQLVLPIFQQYVIHLYRMRALAALYKPIWTNKPGFATKEHLL